MPGKGCGLLVPVVCFLFAFVSLGFVFVFERVEFFSECWTNSASSQLLYPSLLKNLKDCQEEARLSLANAAKFKRIGSQEWLPAPNMTRTHVITKEGVRNEGRKE